MKWYKDKSDKLIGLMGLLLIIIISLSLIFTFNILSSAYNDSTPIEQHFNPETKIYPITPKILSNGFQQFNFSLPTNFTNDLVETFMDVLWDVDNDSGGGGLFITIFSFVPFLGSNGDATITVIFFLSVFAGVVLFRRRILG